MYRAVRGTQSETRSVNGGPQFSTKEMWMKITATIWITLDEDNIAIEFATTGDVVFPVHWRAETDEEPKSWEENRPPVSKEGYREAYKQAAHELLHL